MSTRVYCYDTEFLEDGHTIELISIGIVCDDGAEYYAVNSDMPVDRIKQSPWLMENVWPQLPLRGYETRLATLLGGDLGPKISSAGVLDTTSVVVKPKWVIANEVREFILESVQMGDRPELWADYGAYDHVVLAQLFGRMVDLPKHMPMFTHELEQLREQLPGSVVLPEQGEGAHNALSDARHNMRVYQAAMSALRTSVVDGNAGA